MTNTDKPTPIDFSEQALALATDMKEKLPNTWELLYHNGLMPEIVAYIKQYGIQERIELTKLIESDIEDLPVIDGHLIAIEEIEGVFKYRLEKENVVVQGKLIDLGLTTTQDKETK